MTQTMTQLITGRGLIHLDIPPVVHDLWHHDHISGVFRGHPASIPEPSRGRFPRRSLQGESGLEASRPLLGKRQASGVGKPETFIKPFISLGVRFLGLHSFLTCTAK